MIRRALALLGHALAIAENWFWPRPRPFDPAEYLAHIGYWPEDE